MRLDTICEVNAIAPPPRTTLHHAWLHGQGEQMNRTITEATMKRFHDASHDQRRTRAGVMAAYHYSRRLKTLNGRNTP